MNVSAPIAEREVNIHYEIPSSRQNHVDGARPRKRGDDAPSAGGLAPRTFNVLHEYVSGPLGSVRRSRSPTHPSPILWVSVREGGDEPS